MSLSRADRARRRTPRAWVAASEAARRLSALRVIDPPAWRLEVRTALAATGTVPDAARQLGVSRSTLHVWMRADPAIRAGLSIRGPGDPGRGANLPTHPRAKRDAVG